MEDDESSTGEAASVASVASAGAARDASSPATRDDARDVIREFRGGFYEWLWAKQRRVRVLFSGFSALLLSGLNVLLRAIGELEHVLVYAPLVLNVLIAITFYSILPKAPETRSPISTKAARLIRELWSYMLGVWALLYLVLVAKRAFDDPQLSRVADYAWHVLRNVNAMLLLRIYLELTTTTFDPRGQRTGGKPARMTIIIVVAVLLFADVGLSQLGKLHTLGSHPLVFDPAFLLDVMCWVLTAACLGLFVSRLASQLLGVPIAVLLMLAAYAGLQVAGPFLYLGSENDSTLQIGVFTLALLFKLLLCALMHWLVSERLGFYVSISRDVHIAAPRIYRDYLETRGDSERECNVFLSAPLAGRPDKRALLSAFGRIKQIVEDELELTTMAPLTSEEIDYEQQPATARRENLFRIRKCLVFVMVYDSTSASGALIELGAALAHGKPILIYYQETLPPLARPEEGRHDRITAYEVHDIENVVVRIADDLRQILAPIVQLPAHRDGRI